MACNIETGYALSNTTVATGDCIVKSPGGKVILFQPETLPGTKYSRAFTVSPGRAVLIDAYNLPFEYKIYTNRLVVSTSCKVQGSNCDPYAMAQAYGNSAMIIFRERMTIGNSLDQWTLENFDQSASNAKPPRLQMLITLPGTYELELEDPDAMLGSLEVELAEYDLAKLGMVLPYMAGVKYGIS